MFLHVYVSDVCMGDEGMGGWEDGGVLSSLTFIIVKALTFHLPQEERPADLTRPDN